ncbi:PRC-barrel domain containing protein [Halopelagius fulvigenes]|uniref:PRC-barrel domain containing protein n=1 Tax=Halopelagius fulvigenes TaxID=1198324 RepID=A0ABD5TUA1_9EURY
MTAELSDDDRGKTVVSGTERIGVVTDVRGDRAYVEPEWDNVDEGLKRTLGWDEDDDTYTIEESAFTTVQNTEVRLRSDLF